MSGRRLFLSLAAAAVATSAALVPSGAASAVGMTVTTPDSAVSPNGLWTPVFRHDFGTTTNVTSFESSKAVNSTLLPTDTSNDLLQKPSLRSNVAIVNDPETADGKAIVAYTRRGSYATSSGVTTGWTNGRFLVSNYQDVPVRVTARVKMTPSAGAKTAVMWWPAGGGWPWEVDFAETFGGKSLTDYWGSRQNVAQRWHGDVDGDGRAVEQLVADTAVDATKYHVYDLFITPDRMWVQIDGVTAYSTTDKRFIPTGEGFFSVGKALTGAREGAFRTEDAVYVDYLEISKPTVGTAPVAEVRVAEQGATAAQVVADVRTGGLPTKVRFEYGTAGAATTSSAPVTVTADGQVEATLTELAPGQTYTFRAVAENAAGTTTSAEGSATAPGIPPSADVRLTAQGVTTAAVAADVRTGGLPTEVRFEYGTEGAATSSTPPVTVVADGQVQATLTDLVPGRTYSFRAVTENSAGATTSAGATVTTPGAPGVSVPTVTGQSLTSITVSGTVQTSGLPTQARVEYGTTTGYGQSVPATIDPSGRITATIPDLTARTVYNVRIVAESEAGSTPGSNLVTGTTGVPNVFVSTLDPTASTVTINGTVRPFSLDTTYYVEYGRTTTYGMTTPTQVISAGLWGVKVNPVLTGLQANSCYKFRLVAVNAEGTSRSGVWTACT